MSVTLYSGTPGAGKSLDVARLIYDRLRVAKRPVMATFPITMDIVTKKGKKKTADFIYCGIEDMTSEYLIEYALQHHELGRENQTLVVIDECQIIFNPREFSRKDRLKWIVFFTQHRKLGYEFVLISQFDRLIDRQIRCLLEYNVIHRKANNFGFWAYFLPFKLFVAVSVWYGAKEVCGRRFFIYRKKYGKMYDSFMMFDEAFKDYVRENGDKVSEHNKKVLGLDKPKEPTKELPEPESDFTDEEIVNAEVERYAGILEELPDGTGSRDEIEKEVSEAFNKIENASFDDDAPADGRDVAELDALRAEFGNATKAVPYSPPGRPDVEAGVRGSLPKRAEPPEANTLTRFWKFLNTPVTFRRQPEKTE